MLRSDSGTSSNSSDGDSDSATALRNHGHTWKRSRISASVNVAGKNHHTDNCNHSRSHSGKTSSSTFAASSGRKVNNIWGDVLTDQSLTDAMHQSAKVQRPQDTVVRGAETYDFNGKDITFQIRAADLQKATPDKQMDQCQESATVKGELNCFCLGNPLDALPETTELPEGFGVNKEKKRQIPETIRNIYESDKEIVHKGHSTNYRKRKARGNYRGGRQHSQDGRKRGGPYRPVLKEDDPPVQVGVRIAHALEELKIQLMVDVVKIIGSAKAINCYNETLKVQGNGGMMTLRGDRRKTPGGVFLSLVKEDPEIDQLKVNQVFSDDKQRSMDHFKRQQNGHRNQRFEKQLAFTKTHVNELQEKKDVFLEEMGLGKGSIKVEGVAQMEEGEVGDEKGATAEEEMTMAKYFWDCSAAENDM